MGMKDIIKKLVITILLMMGLVVGYVYSKPYIPTISSKYQAIIHSVQQIITGQEAVKEESEQKPEELPVSEMTKETTSVKETSSESSSTPDLVTDPNNADIKSHLHPNDFIHIVFSGYNGNGTVKHTINQEALEEKLHLSDVTAEDFLENLQVEIDPHQYLSNGDSVKVVVHNSDAFKDVMPDYVLKTQVKGLKDRKLFTEHMIEKAIDVTFDGFNESGTLSYQVSFDSGFETLDIQTPGQTEKLSNGDEIIFELTDESKQWLQSQNYTIENNGKWVTYVEGLENMEEISSETINRHVVVNFVGTSGAGVARIDATFQPPLSKYLSKDSFEVTNNGHIKNDEVVKITIKPEIIEKMYDAGYDIENQGQIERTAKNMLQVSEDFKGIKNHKLLQEKVDKELKQQFPDTLFGSYDIKLERYYYRPYHTENDVIQLDDVKQDGTFLGVYTVTSYDRDRKHVRTKETHVFGYTDLFINDESEVNLENPIEFKTKYDETYSLDSVYQILEGFNFKKVTK